MMNIVFEYLYRDAGNYKQWGDVVLSNPNCYSIEKVHTLIQKAMPHGEFFNALSVRLPDLHFKEYSADLDLLLHEFFGVSITDQNPNDLHDRSIDDLVEEIANDKLV